jgi:hypothetical protein
MFVSIKIKEFDEFLVGNALTAPFMKKVYIFEEQNSKSNEQLN